VTTKVTKTFNHEGHEKPIFTKVTKDAVDWPQRGRAWSACYAGRPIDRVSL